MRTIKELEAFERDHNNNPKITANKMNPRHQGKLQALKDVLKLIDEMKKEYDESWILSLLEELKSRITG